MKRIQINEIPSLKGNELLEIKLMSNKTTVGFLSTYKSSISPNAANSKGVLDYLVLRYENEIEDESFISDFMDRIINTEMIREVYIRDYKLK